MVRAINRVRISFMLLAHFGDDESFLPSCAR